MKREDLATLATCEESRIALLESERRILEGIATGEPLEGILQMLVNLVEQQAGDMRCAILLADSAQKRLRLVAETAITDEYRTAIEPYLVIGPGAVSCGMAAFLKQPVYTHDTARDPLWSEVAEVADRNGVRAVWSSPILADDNRVLGVFSMFYPAPRLPGHGHMRLIDMAVQMARVAIEARADTDLIGMAFDQAPFAMLVADVAGQIVRTNEALARQLGYSPRELRGKPLGHIGERTSYESIMPELSGGACDVRGESRYRTRAGKMLLSRERLSLRHDRSGHARFVITAVDEFGIDGATGYPIGKLSARERQVLDLVIEGLSSKAIAKRLGIAAGTVDTYRSRLMVKLGVEDLPNLVRLAIRQGIVAA